MKRLIGLFVVLFCAAQSHAQQITTIELTSLSIPRDRGQDLRSECDRRIKFAISTGKIEGLMANHLSEPEVHAFSIGKEMDQNGGYDWTLTCVTDNGVTVKFTEV